jgi:multiple sugar transport system ATP-binding protein
MAELQLQGVGKRFGEVHALRALDLTVASGELVVLLGPSGAGKTTALRLAAGLERPDQGRVHIAGRDVTGLSPAMRDVTFVFQQYSLYPHLSVYDNLAFPLRAPSRRQREDEIRRRVLDVARLLRIDDKLDSPSTRLSGGQMQRVAIGRALVREPSVALMDEPLSSLDAKLRGELRLELRRVHQETGATMLLVTHDQVEAMTLADRIGVLDQGCLVQLGTPQQIYEEPASTVVAARLGSPRINLLPRDAWPQMPVPPGTATLGIRAEHLCVTAGASGTALPRGAVRARVRRSERLSDLHLVHLELEHGPHGMVSAAPPDHHYANGQAVTVEATKWLCFGTEGQRVAA